MTSSLDELNALLDSFIPLTEKVRTAKTAALEKEAAALELILARVWMVMPYLHEPGQCTLIDRMERTPTGGDSGFGVSNTLTLVEDGPHLVRSFRVARWGTDSPAFEIDDSKDISCVDAIKTYGFEEICAGLVEMLKCQCSIDVEFKELESRIKRADSIVATLDERLKLECCSEEVEAHAQ